MIGIEIMLEDLVNCYVFLILFKFDENKYLLWLNNWLFWFILNIMVGLFVFFKFLVWVVGVGGRGWGREGGGERVFVLRVLIGLILWLLVFVKLGLVN